METIRSLATNLDKVVATLVVSVDSTERRFIGEFLLTAAAAYLLKKFADKYLEGLGFDTWAKKYGQGTARFLEKIRRRQATETEVQEIASAYEEAAELARSRPLSAEALELAYSEAVALLIEFGAVRQQALAEAAKIARQAGKDFQGSPS